MRINLVNGGSNPLEGAAMKKEKCSYANKYKAIRPPTCGCQHCWVKWNLKSN